MWWWCCWNIDVPAWSPRWGGRDRNRSHIYSPLLVKEGIIIGLLPNSTTPFIPSPFSPILFRMHLPSFLFVLRCSIVMQVVAPGVSQNTCLSSEISFQLMVFLPYMQEWYICTSRRISPSSKPSRRGEITISEGSHKWWLYWNYSGFPWNSRIDFHSKVRAEGNSTWLRR